MRKDNIFTSAVRMAEKYASPYELLEALGAVTIISQQYGSDGLKGYCYFSKRTVFVVINGKVCREERRVVAAHEAAHVILHRDLMKVAPMRDFCLYDMKSRCEYEANMFAADFLLKDSEVSSLAESKDYFHMCSELRVSPDLMAFKLFSMISRGYDYSLPQSLNSTFLKP